MNPYEVLGVPSTATNQEIKVAYRRAVKQHHPDVSDTSSSFITELNHAYDILSDPQKRVAYDNRLNWVVMKKPDDPREIYKREFLRKKRAEAIARRKWERRLFQKMYKLNIWITVFAAVLIADEFLPKVKYQESITAERTERRADMHQSYYMHYIQTPSREVMVREPERTGTEYFGRIPITIHTSPIFGIPTLVNLVSNSRALSLAPVLTLFSFPLPFHYMLMAFSVGALSMREYRSFSFSFCFTPCVLLGFVLILYWSLA